MICPFCLGQNPSTVEQCSYPHCNQPFPPAYLQLHQGRRDPEPIIVSIVGFSGHGKTVYLAALFDTLDHIVPQIWSEFSRRALDQDTLSYVDKNRHLLQQGVLPESTRLNFPKPSIHRLSGIPQYGDRTLLLYDPPGEAFNLDEGIGQYAGFVKRSNCVLFLISLPDLDHPVADGMFKLLNTYILGMSRLGVPPQAQHLIITYTKADEIFEPLASPELKVYLRQQGLGTLNNLKEYLKAMDRVSVLLQELTNSQLNAHAFVNEANRYFKSVRYTSVSALGTAPRNGTLEEIISPRRVIDPLLWVLTKHEIIKEPSMPIPKPQPSSPSSQSSSYKFSSRTLIWMIMAVILIIVVGIALTRQPDAQPQTPAVSPNLTGEWIVTDTIEQTSYNPYLGLRLSYRMFLQQNGNVVRGTGEKVSENGNDLPPSAHSPIRIEGTLNGIALNATFVEEGKRRTTTGNFSWDVAENGKSLQGRFTHTAANSSGISIGKKVK